MLDPSLESPAITPPFGTKLDDEGSGGGEPGMRAGGMRSSHVCLRLGMVAPERSDTRASGSCLHYRPGKVLFGSNVSWVIGVFGVSWIAS